MPNLTLILLFTLVVHGLDTASYASRIAGARTGRPALAGALFNVVALGSRTANMVLAALVANAVDRSVRLGDTDELAGGFRLIMLTATAGTALGALLIPTFSALLTRATGAYEAHRSFLTLILFALTPRGLGRIVQEMRMPLPESVREARQSGLPRSFLLLNAGVVAIYTVGVLAAGYASALVPDLARTATSLSGAVNGFGTLLLVLLVDPVSALIVDEALRGERPQSAVSHIVVWQVTGRLLGTLAAQALFIPAAHVVMAIARLIQ